MATERLSMRKVREVPRLKHAVGLTYRESARRRASGGRRVWQYIRPAEAIGITWPVPADVDDTTLKRRMLCAQVAPIIGS